MGIGYILKDTGDITGTQERLNLPMINTRKGAKKEYYYLGGNDNVN
mgnify:CR=1 FL=1